MTRLVGICTETIILIRIEIKEIESKSLLLSELKSFRARTLLVKDRNFSQNLKFWPNIEISVRFEILGKI